MASSYPQQLAEAIREFLPAHAFARVPVGRARRWRPQRLAWLALLSSWGEGATLAAGLRREGEILKELGLDPLTVSFGGGAGGEWADMATPRAAATLLRAMAARPDFASYDAALPILGRDGTLAKAVAEDSPARGHARAKTGTMFVSDALIGRRLLTAKGLAGYMETAAGRPLVIAFFLNGVILDAREGGKVPTTADAGKLLGRLCEAFYLGDGPAPPPADRPLGGK